MIRELDFIPLNTKEGFHLIRGTMTLWNCSFIDALITIAKTRDYAISKAIHDIEVINEANSDLINSISVSLRGGL